jgi:hypothetical protein
MPRLSLGEEPDATGIRHSQAGRFAQPRACLAEVKEWLAGPDAACLTHAELEEQLVRGAVSSPERSAPDSCEP